MPKGALCLSARLRMLQKPASVVLASPKCFAQAGRLAQGLNVMKARANYLFARCGPCWMIFSNILRAFTAHVHVLGVRP